MDITEAVKRYLDISWEDPDTDAKVEDTITSAKARINDHAGVEVDLTQDVLAFQLFKDCCRYIYNKVLDEFEKNYASELIALRNKYMVQAYEEEESSV